MYNILCEFKKGKKRRFSFIKDSAKNADRRKKCNVPEGIEFKSKPQLAVEMFQELQNQETLLFKYVVADFVYGNSPEFIDAGESCVGTIYFVSTPADTLCWLQRPITRKKQYKFKGQVRSKEVVEKTEKKPLLVETLAKSINDYF